MKFPKLLISPWFYVLAFFFAFFGNILTFLIYFITIVLHELSHAFVSLKLGYKLSDIVVMPYGVKLSLKSNFLKKKDEIIIALAGPLFNLIVCILLMGLWWIFPIIYDYTIMVFNANFITFAFNLIPVFPLDGGRVLNAIINNKKISKFINICLCVVFFVAFVISIFFKINFNIFFITLFLIVNLFDKKTSYYKMSINLGPNISQLRKGIIVENYAINLNSTLLDCYKLIKNDRLTTFVLLNNNYKVINKFTAKDIETFLYTHNAQTKFEKLIM